MDVSDSGGHKKGLGVKKSKKKSARVDLTAMVDLGFLLITFFIFTTTMAQPSAMDLNMPKDTEQDKDKNKLKESGALILMLGKGDVVYWYEGLDATALQPTGYKDIRNVILSKKKRTKADDFMVVIKPMEDATYKNTVDILDEMKINVVERFALVDISPQEVELVRATETANGIQ